MDARSDVRAAGLEVLDGSGEGDAIAAFLVEDDEELARWDDEGDCGSGGGRGAVDGVAVAAGCVGTGGRPPVRRTSMDCWSAFAMAILSSAL
jgi:hypothetical protein